MPQGPRVRVTVTAMVRSSVYHYKGRFTIRGCDMYDKGPSLRGSGCALAYLQ